MAPARDITFDEIIARAKQAADMVGSNLLETGEDRDIVNESYGQWYYMVARAVPERFEKTQSITATGATSYAVASDYASTMGVEYVNSDSTVIVPLERLIDMGVGARAGVGEQKHLR